MATIDEMKTALVNAHKAGDTAAATKIAGMIKQQMAVTPRDPKVVQAEYDKMPWYSQLGTAADDLVRIGASGISFGGIDRLLGPEQQKLTEEARMRAGWAGTAADVGGAVASPITRAVGIGGKVASELLTPVAKQAPGLLARIGIGAGEGATTGAIDAKIKGNDVGSGAETGAAIAAAIPVIGKTLARASSFLQATKPGAIEDAYVAGRTGGSTGKAFRQAQVGKPIVDAQKDFATAESGWSTGAVNPKILRDEVTAIRKEVVTPTGMSKLTTEDKTAFDKINTVILKGMKRGQNVQNFDAMRRQIDAWSDGTDMQKMMATRLKEAIRKSVQKVEPTYVPTLDKYSGAKVAQAAGKELQNVFPNGGLLGHLAQTALLGSSIVGSSIVGPGAAATIPMFSPKLSGLIANILGETAGRTGATLGAAAPVYSNYQDRRKEERKRRKAND
jgi:hypothetical protein